MTVWVGCCVQILVILNDGARLDILLFSYALIAQIQTQAPQAHKHTSINAVSTAPLNTYSALDTQEYQQMRSDTVQQVQWECGEEGDIN